MTTKQDIFELVERAYKEKRTGARIEPFCSGATKKIPTSYRITVGGNMFYVGVISFGRGRNHRRMYHAATMRGAYCDDNLELMYSLIQQATFPEEAISDTNSTINGTAINTIGE